MAFLTIGAVTVEVITTGASEEPEEEGVHTERAANGQLRAAVLFTSKRRWTFEALCRTETIFANLKAAANYPATVSCAGDAIGGTVNCKVLVGSRSYMADGTGFVRTAALFIREV